MNDCQKIKSAILKSGNGWVSFMHELVSHLFLNGQDIQTFLGIQDLFNDKSKDEDDEDFED